MRTLEQLVAIFEAAAPGGSVEATRDPRWRERARLEFDGAQTIKYAYLHVRPAELLLGVYPADTLGQARVLYNDGSRCRRLLALREQGWEIRPNFHFGFVARGLTFSRSRINAEAYVKYWVERIHGTEGIARADWQKELTRLVTDGIFNPENLPDFDRDFRKTNRATAIPRPGLEALRRWPDNAPAVRDFDGQVRGVRQALTDVLAALDEPPL